MGWARTSRHERGYGTAWDKLRKRILTRDKYLCQACVRKGRLTQAGEVDHKKPKAKGGTDSEDNLEAICSLCHKAKTAAENGRSTKVKIEIGIDGWPVADR